jgi:hypothetical protein
VDIDGARLGKETFRRLSGVEVDGTRLGRKEVLAEGTFTEDCEENGVDG